MRTIFAGIALLCLFPANSAFAERPLNCYSIEGKYTLSVTGEADSRTAVVYANGAEAENGNLSCEQKTTLPYKCNSVQYRIVVKGTCHTQRVDLYEGDDFIDTLECNW